MKNKKKKDTPIETNVNFTPNLSIKWKKEYFSLKETYLNLKIEEKYENINFETLFDKFRKSNF